MSEKKVFWMGPVPTNCDLCRGVLREEFVDGRVVSVGGWAVTCVPCHKQMGVGLGMGKGQLFRREEEGWRKVEG